MAFPAHTQGDNTHRWIRGRRGGVGEGIAVRTHVVVHSKVGELHCHCYQKDSTVNNALLKILFQIHKLLQSVERKGCQWQTPLHDAGLKWTMFSGELKEAIAT